MKKKKEMGVGLNKKKNLEKKKKGEELCTKGMRVEV